MIPNREGYTPLMGALQGLTREAVDICRNCSPAEQRRQGAALMADCAAIVKMLLAAGANPNVKCGAERTSPLR